MAEKKKAGKRSVEQAMLDVLIRLGRKFGQDVTELQEHYDYEPTNPHAEETPHGIGRPWTDEEKRANELRQSGR